MGGSAAKRQRILLGVAAVVVACVVSAVDLGCTDAPSPMAGSVEPSFAVTAATSAPAPPAASPTAQEWECCGNIRDEADARSLVSGGIATSLVEARITGTAVTSYTVLAGHVQGLRTLNLAAPGPGRYLVLLGGTTPDYYVALGYYGMYRVDGLDAYQLCAYGEPEQKRRGVTAAAGLIDLLRQALQA